MTKILGIDLGTNSIGWAIVEENKSEKEFNLIDKGVRIFSEGVNIEAKTNSESSKAAQRTNYRSARKLKYRRKLRKIELLKVLIKHNLCPLLNDEELRLWRYKKIYPKNEDFRGWLSTDNQNDLDQRKKQIKNPYYFRFKAVTDQLNLELQEDRYILGRALYHISQRRGFLSNRLDTSDESIVEEKNSEIEDLIQHANSSGELILLYQSFLESYDSKEPHVKALFTLGRAFKAIIKDNPKIKYNDLKIKLLERLNRKEFLGKVKSAINDLSQDIERSKSKTLGAYFYKLHLDGQRIRNQYTHREEHYLAEFNEICNLQAVDIVLKKALERAIFYQRPLKSQKGLVAKCPLETDKACVPVSHPAYEVFRQVSFLNNIKIKTESDEKLRVLTNEERLSISSLFFRKSKPHFDFDDIAKKLTPKHQTYGSVKSKDKNQFDVLFNYNKHVNVSGCPTIAHLRYVFGVDWENTIVNSFKTKNKDGSEKSVFQIIDAIWHALVTFNDVKKLQEFAVKHLNCNKDTAIKFSKIKLKQGYGSLSLKAIRNINPYLKEGLLYSHAVFLANLKAVLPKNIWENPNDKKIIEHEIYAIIESYNDYKFKVELVNGFIASIKEIKGTWSEANHFVTDVYKKELKTILIKQFGLKKWDALSLKKQEAFFEDIFQLFKTQMSKNLSRGEFLKRETLSERVKTFLRNHFNAKELDLEKLYHPSAMEVYKPAWRNKEDGKLYLGSPLISSIKNPMAMRSLHQLRSVINQLIKDDVINESTIVRVEMARELKSANQRGAIKTWQTILQKKRKDFVTEIKQLYKEQCGLEIEPTKDEILKFQLWHEQNKTCIYTGKTIGICDFIGANPKFDIEHTIPRSKSLDNSQVNKTLCCTIYNRDIKKSKIPTECPNYENIMLQIKHWYAKYKGLEQQIRLLTKKVRGATTKEIKDGYIQKRSVLDFEYQYYRAKYKTFTITEIPKSFKNSQLVDIGIVSKYGHLYLKSLFNKVYTVKGKTTSNLRAVWGLDKKERINHAHHAKDAVVVACCSKDINDALANYYHNYEDYKYYGKSKPSFKHRIPWKGFKMDVDGFDDTTLISHYTPDVLPKQSKKAIRKRGVRQKNAKGDILYKQGDTVRGTLHKESFYGAIKREITNKKGESESVVKYVLRKPLDSFSDTDLKHIVDDTVKEIVINGRQLEKTYKTEIETLKKQVNKVNDEEEALLKVKIKELEFKITNELYVLPNKNGKPVPIKRIRYFTTDVKVPLEIKKHRDISKHKYKQHVFAKNDGNYCMAIYEGLDDKGKQKRSNLLINNLEAGKYYKQSNTNNKIYPVAPEKDINNYPLKYVLTKGKMVLLYDKTPAELYDLDELQLLEHLFKITQLDVERSAEIKLLHHVEARDKKEITQFMGLKSGMKGGKNIGDYKKYPWIKIGVNNFDCLVEGYHFSISASGKLELFK